MLKDLTAQRAFEDLFEMHATRGWAALMELAQDKRDELSNVAHIKDLDDLRGRQGQLFILDWLLTHKSVTEIVYATRLESENGA